MNDGKPIYLGNHLDLNIRHDGNNSIISHSGTGDLLINTADGEKIYVDTSEIVFRNAASNETLIKATQNGSVELYYNGTKRFETNNTGAFCTGELGCDTLYMGDNEKVKMGGSDDMQLYHDGSSNHINYSNGNLLMRQGSHTSSQCLQFDGNGHLYVPDNEMIYFGSSADLQIKHDGSNSIINEAGTGSLRIQTGGTNQWEFNGAIFKGNDGRAVVLGDSSDLEIFHNGTDSIINCKNDKTLKIVNDVDGGNETMALFDPNGGVNLYHNGNTVCNTASYGLQMQDGMDIQITDSDYLYLGNAGDMALYHDGTDNHIKVDQTLSIISSTQTLAEFIPNNYVKLFYQGSSRLETNGNGIKVHANAGPSLLLSGTMGSSECIHIQNTTSGGVCQIGFQSNDTDGLHHRAYIVSKKGPSDGNYQGSYQVITRGKTFDGGGFLLSTGTNSAKFQYNVVPYSDDDYDLGSASLRWQNVYTADLQLSNEGKSNDVDGTWGNYTIQEGESDLFLINNRSGKKYKFNLTEVS